MEHRKHQISIAKIRRLRVHYNNRKTHFYTSKEVGVSLSTVSKYFYAFRIADEKY